MHSSKNTITNEMKESNGLCQSLVFPSLHANRKSGSGNEIDYLIDESSLVSLINEFV
jgi:hypothetical protein